MSLLSPKIVLKQAQTQVLTPSLVQMVKVLQLTRMELKEMIADEMAENPMIEEVQEGQEEDFTPEELQALLEAERLAEPADKSILDATQEPPEIDVMEADLPPIEAIAPDPPPQTDPFEEIDLDEFFGNYLDPGLKSPAGESVEKTSFEDFLANPPKLTDHLEQQLAILVLPPKVRQAAVDIVGNLDDNGYLMSPLEEIAAEGEHALADLEKALEAVQGLDPAGVGCRDLRECLLLQLRSRNGEGGVAWQICRDHLKLLETRQLKEIARLLGRPLEHVQIAVNVIKHLNPEPGLRYAPSNAQKVEPDVYITKDGEDYLIQLNDDDLPQIRLNPSYRGMLDRDRDREASRDTRNYIKDRYTAALQLIKNIEQRRQTIQKVCQAIVRRQREFLEAGLDQLRPMMIKDVAEEIGVHPSTVSRAVAGKFAHTPQGVFELRYFFGEAVQGPSGGGMSLATLKRRVKKMIEEEDPNKPLTDEQITEKLQAEGIQVTRRTVAKYREDMKIPSTHQRRKRE
jgi:RNA polymerase sigma-54 factor